MPGGAPWLCGARRRFAGVSSFGFSGTNAHVVVEEAPTLPQTATNSETPGPQLLTLSARSTASLSRAAHAYVQALSPGGDLAETPLEDVCFTAGLKRHHHEQRLAAVGQTREDLLKGLRSYLDGDRSWTVLRGRAPAGPETGAVFVFSGQGSQWAGMGRALIQSEEVARRTFEECADLVERLGGPSLHDEIHREESDSRLSSTSVAQPAILALQLAVAAQLRAWGIEPVAVVGHSAGEVAAAHVAGALSLEDAIRIVALRSRRMEAATDRGKMLAAALSRHDAEEIVGASNGELSLASANAAASVVLSGEVEAIEECRRWLVKQGIWCQALDLRYAFHSHQMADVCVGLAEDLKGLVPSKTTVPFVSTVSGKTIAGESLTAEYWERNAVQTVEFSSAIETLVASGLRRYIGDRTASGAGWVHRQRAGFHRSISGHRDAAPASRRPTCPPRDSGRTACGRRPRGSEAPCAACPNCQPAGLCMGSATPLGQPNSTPPGPLPRRETWVASPDRPRAVDRPRVGNALERSSRLRNVVEHPAARVSCRPSHSWPSAVSRHGIPSHGGVGCVAHVWACRPARGCLHSCAPRP